MANEELFRNSRNDDGSGSVEDVSLRRMDTTFFVHIGAIDGYADKWMRCERLWFSTKLLDALVRSL